MTGSRVGNLFAYSVVDGRQKHPSTGTIEISRLPLYLKPFNRQEHHSHQMYMVMYSKETMNHNSKIHRWFYSTLSMTF